MTYTEDGVPQRPTRKRFADVPVADRTEGQRNAYQYDYQNQTEKMREALDDIPEFRGCEW